MSQLETTMKQMGTNARAASRIVATSPDQQKSDALRNAASELERRLDAILTANESDLAQGQQLGLTTAMLDRLRLDPERVFSIGDSLRAIADLEDPVGKSIAKWTRPNGLAIERVRTPLGVVGVIYESRPNVTADAGALCLKSGNAAILRCGSSSMKSSRAIHACLQAGLTSESLPVTAIQLVETTDRLAVREMLQGLDGNIDVIVPRGGKSLVSRVQNEARVPVFAHLEGICHVYVDGEADLDMAVAVVANSKMRRPGICGATETMLIDRRCLESHLKSILNELVARGCEIRGDESVCASFPSAVLAEESDWSTEYLAPIISVKVVDGVDGAITHIQTYSSQHTESIVTDNKLAAERFLAQLDSAILLHNASTQFADGGEFGMGAEIGIATGKMHARGPVGVEQLTSFNYRVRGNGQVRP